MARRTSMWLPFVTLLTGFTSLTANSFVYIVIPSIVEADLGMDLSQYTTQRVIFTFLLESQGVDIIVALGMVYRQESSGAADAPSPGLQPATNWQYHEYVVNGSTDDDPTMIRRDVAISRKMRGTDMDLVLTVDNRTSVTIAFWAGGRALMLRA